MSIPDLAINNRVAVVVLTVALTLAGLVAYVALPKESQPQIEFATIVVTTIYPGASPDDIEAIITQEVEREVNSISGLDELRSTSTEGVSTVIAEFLPDKDINEASREVREAVDLAKTEFPADVEEPIVSEIDVSEFPVLTVNLLTAGSLSDLRETAEDLQDEIEGVPGVLEVDLLGGLEREVQVDADLTALQGYNLSINDLVTAVQTENTNIPGGSIDVGPENYLVRVDGEFDDPSEILDLVVAAPGGVPVYVRDLADVRFGYKDRESYARLEVLQRENADGEPVPVEGAEDLQVIRLNVKKQAGENIIEVVDGVERAIEDYALPSGTSYVLTGDQSEEVESLVKDLENNIIAGILFVIAVLLFFLGVRNAALVGVAIPLSMFLSFLVFSVMGETLNFIILFSLIIALGMLVDNAVVIIENIYRYREEGYGRWEAAREATNEVGLAVAASTATTVAAFAPMLLWPGIIGKFMSYMPLTLIVTLLSSLFVALVINPVITGYFMETDEEATARRAAPPSPTARKVGLGLVAFTALVVGVANWKTLVFLAVAVPGLYALYKYALEPAHHRFARRTVPAMTARYRAFLAWMLQRDYDAPRAMLRNTFALGAFTVGFLLLVAGAAVNAAAPPAGWILIAPGGVALVAGLLGFVVHSLETAFLGGRTSVRVGLVFGAVVAVLVVLLVLSGRIDVSTLEGVEVIVGMFLLPALVAGAGALGVVFGPGGRRDATRNGDAAHNGRNGNERGGAGRNGAGRTTADGQPYLILTDNRARLLTATMGLLVGVIALFFVAPTGVEFFPTTDPNLIQITAEAPTGTTIERSNEVAGEVFGRVQALVEEDPASAANTENISTSVGVGGDAAFGGGAASAERSRVTLNLVDYADRAEPSSITLRRIRDRLAGLPGVDLQVEQNQNGPPTGAAVNIEVSGEAFDEIQDIADGLKAKLEEGVESGAITGLVDIRDNLGSGRPEYRVEIDRERAAAFGLSTQQVAFAVRGAINGIEASQYRDGKDEYDVTVRLREADRENLRQLESLTVLAEGRQVPLVSVAQIVPASGLGSVTRLGQERVVTVQGDAAPGANAQAVLQEVQAYLADDVAAVPSGYTVAYTGESEDQQESFGFLTTALLIGLSLISIILIAQFNSVKNPFIIMVAVGLSLIGVLLGLILTRTPFGLFTFIGVISLAGIVVNNAIVLVDYIEQLRARGEDKQEAIIDGGATRLRPVLLTAFTTVIGLIPLTFGINIDFVGLIVNLDPSFSIGSENTQFWGPMGTAIISGLTFATFLTLVIVPVMYSAFDSLAVRLSSATDEATGGADAGGVDDGALVLDGDGAAEGRPLPAVVREG
ncbi:efflux RND transporter permease subunit [Rubrivirga sp. S365]|uniref:efflux RND transporter permease subunit n=1 Tax=Rubrivirga sp. S365 TaxID=3076080 RepID=UPI0028C8692C|nr:efflux RND transporter permease subunit [Rubrivirga sp. S365]MDT7855047.1 efflux RND transporter permease subunit [Rubrivirga sp. S365]